jgi:hypothetical protein
MRDGVTLMADVHRPDSPGRFPVILERTPYDKTASSETRFGAGEFFASRGFVAVFQDVRGRFASQGDFYPFRDDGWGERQDGYDTVEWCAVQPWSTGRIGTIGGSYSGATQYRMLPTRPPHLTCQFVRQSSSDYHNEWVYRSGAFELAFNLSWTLRHTANHATRIAAPAEAPAVKAGLDAAVADLDRWFSHLPQDPMPPMQGAYDWYRDWLAHPDDGPYWRQWNIASKHQDVNTPVFHLGSWFDGFLRGAIENYTGIRRHGRSSLARASQRLLIGPWVHGPDSVATPKVGEADFGPTAALPFNEFRLPWFDYWLKDIPNGVMDTAPVRVFTMGANTWQDLSDWPPPGVRYAPLYLRSGKSNSARSLNDGVASFTAPDETSSSDSYEYDPMRPVPHLGGGHLGPKNGAYDQRPVENRVLTYTTDPLTADLEVTGPVKAVLHAHSTARDTDWVVRLTDVRPDGTSMLVCDGVLRARYRRSQTTPELLTGGIEQYKIDLWATSYLFKRGHRLRVAVTSSCFPRWDRNMNTGGHNSRESKGVVATNTVFHDASRPSHLVLPVIPR